jgi:hypothetical protein
VCVVRVFHPPRARFEFFIHRAHDSSFRSTPSVGFARPIFCVSKLYFCISRIKQSTQKYLFLSQLLKMVDTKNKSLFFMMVEIISIFFVMVEIISCHHKKSPRVTIKSFF